MKNHWNLFAWVSAAGLLFSGCGDDEKPEPAGGSDGGAGAAAVVEPAPVAALSADERAASLGIVRHLPADTEALIAVYDGNEVLKRLKSLKLWKFLEEQGAMEELDIPGDLGETGADEFGPGTVFGEEFFLATGPGTGEQTANLLRLNNRMSHLQMKMGVQMLASLVAGDGEGAPEMAFERIFIDLIKDPESGIGVIEKASMPPLVVGFKASGEAGEAAAQEIAALIENMGDGEELVEAVSFKQAGAEFAGYRLIGSKVAEMMRAEAAEDLGEILDPGEIDRLMKAIATKNLVVASGTVGDYVLILAGSSVEQCKLADSASNSLAANSDLAFVDEFAGKDLVALTYGTKVLLDAVTSQSGGFRTMAGGIREGLADTDAFGNTREIEALLQIISEREEALMATLENSTGGLVALFDQGFRIESYGGSCNPMATDPKATHQLAGIGEGEDVVFFSNWTSTEEYGKLVTAYVEALGETSYAMASKVAGLEIDDGDFKQFSEGFQMFDSRLREPVLQLWKELSGNFADGLGNEGALVVDLKGTVPPIPGIPQELVDDGVAPRISYICPVTDRQKLQSAWGGIDAASRELLKVASEFAEEEIPMQKPMSSDSDGLKTWFFSAPFFTDDFAPSVTLDDKWFVASTSKQRALDLVKGVGEPGVARSGSWTRVDFDALRKFGGQWLEVLDKHGEAVFKDNLSALEDFRENRPLMDEAMTAVSEFDELTLHSRMVNGKLRISVHFKTR